MTDNLTTAQRSRTMARVRSRDTGVEIFVRRSLFRAGFRFRLHRRDLPGRPDIVLPRYRLAVFVHGCFWHGHSCPAGAAPKSNQTYWDEKLSRNRQRDQRAVEALKCAGWAPVVIWECEKAAGVKRLLEELAARRLG